MIFSGFMSAVHFRNYILREHHITYVSHSVVCSMKCTNWSTFHKDNLSSDKEFHAIILCYVLFSYQYLKRTFRFNGKEIVCKLSCTTRAIRWHQSLQNCILCKFWNSHSLYYHVNDFCTSLLIVSTFVKTVIVCVIMWMIFAHHCSLCPHS